MRTEQIALLYEAKLTDLKKLIVQAGDYHNFPEEEMVIVFEDLIDLKNQLLLA